jgi:hypothetical protein
VPALWQNSCIISPISLLLRSSIDFKSEGGFGGGGVAGASGFGGEARPSLGSEPFLVIRGGATSGGGFFLDDFGSGTNSSSSFDDFGFRPLLVAIGWESGC